MRLFLHVFLILSLALFPLFTQVATVHSQEIEEKFLENFTFGQVSVATKKSMDVRETPGIVSLITKEDIAKSGASDLLEVLTLFVPGVGFGVDVEGVVGIGMRGMWAHEGKLLLMIDGNECNEEQFATTQFGNHYPIEIIERIEVIRGPGSAIYGGYAGVGVVNIITKGKEQNGGFASILYAQSKKDFARRNLAFGYGKDIESEDLGLSITGVVSQGARSDRDNVDISGTSLTMKDQSELNVTNLNVNLAFGGWDIRGIIDTYRTTQIDIWGDNSTVGPVDEDFDTYMLNVKYNFENVGGQDLTITPEWKYKVQFPWQWTHLDPGFGYTNEKRVEKMQAGVSAIWDVTDKVNMVLGIEEHALDLYLPKTPTGYEETYKEGKDVLEYITHVGYAQLMIKTDLVNMALGGRYDDSDEYGSAFVPRIGFTKVFDKYHAKAMYSQSFRTPGGIIPNRIPAGYSSVEPEKASNLEIEVGYQFSPTMHLAVNGFDVEFDKVIVYQSAAGVGSYYNSGEFGTRGIEGVYRYTSKKIGLRCNYAYYMVSKNNVDSYKVTADDNYFLAFPRHRLNLLADYQATDQISIHPSLSYYGKRYGFEYNAVTAASALKDFDPATVVNLNLRIQDLLQEGLEINVGASNLFDEDLDFIMPYDGGHAPLPSNSRTVYARVGYKF